MPTSRDVLCRASMLLQLALLIVTSPLWIPLVLISSPFSLPWLFEKYQSYSRARRDYNKARGTLHLKEIKQSLKALDKELRNLEKEEGRLRKEIEQRRKERNKALVVTLRRHLVRTRMTEVPGIGPKLRDRILRECFDGTLTSLLKADKVNGVGEEKKQALSRWVKQTTKDLPRLILQDFPGKKETASKYNRQIVPLKEKLRAVQEGRASLNELRNKASEEERRLRQVGMSDFRQALASGKKASALVDDYMLGIFPPWGTPPEWYRTLMSNPGEQR